ncbi:hypothetical protein PMI01_05283 [Caulobacter sp. AP07]|uniref:hypothetical protein n=1 Tax=Caulobacter sp. AP07 TaxID=1144304 RepID=UPI00027225DA|nr:hypothetical protein [Caulobacter sp. AP07]EJL21225.1 hypothetical protein PMI01_05283 [Caulobacter sp. AP07]
MSPAAAILAWALALLAPAISSAQPAQMYPRAEQGAVTLVVGVPTGLDVPVTVTPGEVAWTQSARPADGARLVDPLPRRIRPSGKALPAGELLFGYRLVGGMAYCPPLPYKGLRTAQCMRDIDGDGAFDACYIGETRGIRSHFLVALVADLSGCGGRYRYTPAKWSATEAVPVAVLFKGYRDGAPIFLFKIEDQVLEREHRCKPEDDGGCVIMGLRLRAEPVGQAVRITKISAEDVKFETYLGGEVGMRRLIIPKGASR